MREKSNLALNLAPFGRWMLRDKTTQRRLALRYGSICKIISWFVFIQKTAQIYLTEYSLEIVLRILFLKKQKPIFLVETYLKVTWHILQLRNMAKPRLIL